MDSWHSSGTRADPRGCLAVKSLFSPSCFQPLSLAMGTRVGCDDCASPEEGSVAMPAKQRATRNRKEAWARQASGLCGVPDTTSLIGQFPSQLLPCLPFPEYSPWINPLCLSPVYWLPWCNTWTNSSAPCHLGWKETQGGFADWKQELLPFSCLLRITRAGSAVDICVTT